MGLGKNAAKNKSRDIYSLSVSGLLNDLFLRLGRADFDLAPLSRQCWIHGNKILSCPRHDNRKDAAEKKQRASRMWGRKLRNLRIVFSDRIKLAA
jgi:hypothetical protein